jgi:DTW domain-containing protein YfiP
VPDFAAPRSTCSRCLRARSACICAHVLALQPQVEVLILQHPLEVQQSKGSARLLHLSLAGSSLQVGECFDTAQLAQWLHAPGKTSVLLYPATVHDAQGKLLPLAPTPPAALPPSQLRLIVLDGTWRKSRKMLYRNPLLQALPRLSLQAMPPSHYRLRKAHRPDQLSTLEAVCYALMQLEQDEAKYAPLLQAFDGFIAQLAQHWGETQQTIPCQDQPG